MKNTFSIVLASMGLLLPDWLVAAPGTSTNPPAIVRGPYLQLTTQTSTIIRWRTDQPTASWVRYGRTLQELPMQVGDPELVTDHRVTLANLRPGTQYYYVVGTGDIPLSGGPDFYFTTTPDRPKPTRIWAIGDAGTASAGNFGSWAVRDAYYQYAGNRETDVWLMLGDNAYYYGTDYEYQIAVFDTYPTLLRQKAMWSTLGNHETYAPLPSGGFSYFDIYDLPTAGEAGGVPSGTENYYSFDYGNIHFVCVDSEIAARTPGSPMLTWLEADLAANSNEWTIAFWHSPPYTKGSHDSDNLFDNRGNMTDMRANVNPILESYGVDLVLSGHSHNYERSMLLNGHYGFSYELTPSMVLDSGSGKTNDTGAYLKPDTGPSANQGTVYIVAGSSGWATFSTGFHPVMHVAYLTRGSLVIDVEGQRLDCRYLRDTGAIDDHFTILKGAPAEPLRFATIRVADGVVTAQWKSVAGNVYRIQKSGGLKDDDWVTISDEIVASGATTSWADLVLPEDQKCFYRVALVQ